jgi:hypothetical protein
MTKQRRPGSIFDAVFKVVGELGPERVAEICARSESWARKIGDPDSDVTLGLRDAVLLDGEYRNLRGHCPIIEAMGNRLNRTVASPTNPALDDARAAARALKEAGEGIGAFIALGSDATRRDEDRALTEINEMAEQAEVLRRRIESRRLPGSQ